MKMIEKFLTVNQYSRPGRTIGDVKAIILHNGGIPGQRASAIYNFFNYDCPKTRHYSSSQYGIDIDGTVYRWVPDNEVAYHCGSSQNDPASGRIYTDWARAKFGRFAERPDINSPNNCTVGIELCIIDGKGNFTPETLAAAIELTAKLIKDHGLRIDDVGTHHMVVGWKDCPRLWTNEPVRFDEFREAVRKITEEAA
jgi:N-acetylmuramoyl-L-alanine amidase